MTWIVRDLEPNLRTRPIRFGAVANTGGGRFEAVQSKCLEPGIHCMQRRIFMATLAAAAAATAASARAPGGRSRRDLGPLRATLAAC